MKKMICYEALATCKKLILFSLFLASFSTLYAQQKNSKSDVDTSKVRHAPARHISPGRNDSAFSRYHLMWEGDPSVKKIKTKTPKSTVQLPKTNKNDSLLVINNHLAWKGDATIKPQAHPKEKTDSVMKRQLLSKKNTDGPGVRYHLMWEGDASIKKPQKGARN